MVFMLLGLVQAIRRTYLIYKQTALIALVNGRSFKMTLTGSFIADFIFFLCKEEEKRKEN
jgi:hypothetical protein